MSTGYYEYLPSGNFSVDVINSIFAVASIIFFVAIVLTINRLRHRFSASTCFELGLYMFLFVIAADVQIRMLLYQNLLSPIIDSLLTPLRKFFELLAVL